MSQDPDDPSTSAPSPNFETIFTHALKEYKKRTKKDIAAHSLAAQIESCDSPNAVLTVLQTQVQAFDPSPSANERWTRLLDPTITVLYAFSGFVSNVTGPVFPPAAAIFTGIGALLQAIKDVRATQDTLVDLFRRMQFFFMRLEKYIAVQPTAAMTAIIVQVIVEVISILGIATKEIKEGRIKKFFKRLFGINRLKDAFQHLDKLTQEEALMAEAESWVVAARIDKNVIRMGQDINEGVTEARENMQVVLKHVSDLDRNESRKDLRQWINPPDPSSNFHTASDSHHKGTAAWCTSGQAFADWMSSGSLLWIHGKPGSGKTILSSVIIQHFEPMSNSGAVFLAYFYFDFKDERKKDSRALLSSLLDQLSDQSDQFRDVLRGLYSEHRNGSKKPHDDALLLCLKDMLTIARSVPIYLVMDALDECPNDSGDLLSRSPRGKVLSVVEELLELRLPNLRLCITSRPELDIRTIIRPLANKEISLHDESGQSRDINAYVTFVVQSVKNWRDDDKEMVVDKLTENADGMFRWVYCQLEALRPCFPNNLRRMLKELPKTLDETYQRILKEINNANQKQAHQLLQCLAVAHRPLRVEELAEVLALDVDARGIPTFNANWRWEDHEAAVLSACSSLVSVVLRRGSRVVQFSHFSVKEFLTSDRLASMEDVSQFYIADEPSHAILAQACLSVILSVDDHTSEDSVEDIALLPYADRYGGQHAQVGKVELRIKDALDCFFDLDKPHFEAFLRRTGTDRQFRRLRAPSEKDVLIPAALFFVAGVNGLSGLAERLIVPNRPQVLGFRFQGWTLLHWMVHEERIEVARLLLTHGADINSRPDYATPPHIASLQSHVEKPVDGSEEIENGLQIRGADVSSESSEERTNDGMNFGYGKESGFTPLHIAVSKGYLNLCQMLLEHNADVCAHDNKGNTPLHLASSDDHLEISRKLLEYNAKVNSRNEDGSTPLLLALSNGNIDIFRFLLAHNAYAFVHDNRRNTPLHVAAIGGHLEVVRSLLEREEYNAEVNSRNEDGSTPLLLALSNGNIDLFRFLLAHNADGLVHDNRGNTPLHVAAMGGHLEVARMLLELKADIDSLNGEGLTPLHRASEGRRERYLDIVQLLLHHGANVNAHDNHRNTPLHFAASKGHLEVARMLLEHKANVNALNKEGSTPLHHAFEGWRGDVVRLLLNHGSDAKVLAKVHNKSGNTLLHFAASEGDLELARISLEHNAEVINSQNDDGSTAFLLALERQNTDVVWLLLDHNADVHVHDKRGNTPLHEAVCHGHLDVCRILLERNVEVNSQDDHGNTPLLLASQYGPPDLVQLLLEHNADLDLRDGDGDTPLHCAAIGGQLEVAQLLLKVNVDINSRNEMGSTPLHLASAGFGEGNPDVVRLLLDHGADTQARNLSGKTASEVARGQKRQEIVQLFSNRAAE